MSRSRPVHLLFLIPLLFACAQVPREAVTLSDRVGRDLVAMRTAHAALVRQYFGAMRGNIEAFVDSTYRPFIISETMRELDLANEIRAAAEGRHELGLDPLDIMQIYVEEAMARVQTFRAEMLMPVNAQEASLLGDLDAAYNAMIGANATVTAHLRSITKVHEAQQDALARLGIDPDVRDRVAARTARFSEELNGLLGRARAGAEEMEALPGKLREIFEPFR
jgi:hypothetical protein